MRSDITSNLVGVVSDPEKLVRFYSEYHGL